jgi:hypothetical protein
MKLASFAAKTFAQVVTNDISFPICYGLLDPYKPSAEMAHGPIYRRVLS